LLISTNCLIMGMSSVRARPTRQSSVITPAKTELAGCSSCRAGRAPTVVPSGSGSGIVRHAGMPSPNTIKRSTTNRTLFCRKRSIETQIAVRCIFSHVHYLFCVDPSVYIASLVYCRIPKLFNPFSSVLSCPLPCSAVTEVLLKTTDYLFNNRSPQSTHS